MLKPYVLHDASIFKRILTCSKLKHNHKKVSAFRGALKIGDFVANTQVFL
jgi:hypothetical protein